MGHPDQIRRIVRTDPDRPCVVEGERHLSFGEVNDRADRAAEAWLGAGLAAGDRVAVLAHNELEYLEWQIAAQRAGLILVPLNVRLSVSELRDIVGDAGPSLLVHGPGFADQAEALRVGQTLHLGDRGVGESYEAALAAAEPRPRAITDPAALASLLYTSGTTGSAKGAMISNRALLARSLALAVDLSLGRDDVFLQTLPMFHLAQTFSCAFATLGATNVLLRTFDPTAALEAIARHGVTHTLVVPTILQALIAHPDLADVDRSTLRAVFYGASPISETQLARALEAFAGCDFYQMYGMTETGPATLLRPHQHDLSRPEVLRSAGSEIVTFELDIIDANGSPCPDGTAGEIVVTGPALLDGYWRAPEHTRAALRRGLMHTGDIGFRGPDGSLRVTDRLKDIIITGGENVAPIRVEHVLTTHPAIAECAVVPVPHPHWGEQVHAVLVLRDPASPPSTQELDALCRTRLGGYELPRSWSVRDTLPRTATGKVRRHLLRHDLGAPLDQQTDDTDHPAIDEPNRPAAAGTATTEGATRG